MSTLTFEWYKHKDPLYPTILTTTKFGVRGGVVHPYLILANARGEGGVYWKPTSFSFARLRGNQTKLLNNLFFDFQGYRKFSFHFTGGFFWFLYFWSTLVCLFSLYLFWELFCCDVFVSLGWGSMWNHLWFVFRSIPRSIVQLHKFYRNRQSL